MFSFLRKSKLKKSKPITNDNKENTISEAQEKKDRIHVDIDSKPSTKSLLMYDSIEPSPRDLSNSSPHPSSHQACLTHATSPSTPTRNDLNRVLTSGYLNREDNMGYLKRGSGDHIASQTRSPQFHRPIGFSYNRTQTFTVPGTKKGMKALVTGQTKVRKIHCSTPPSVSSTPDHESTVEKEAIVLSRYSGGFIPDPDAPKKIESLDWPAPIALQAVPELMKPHRSRSESRSNHSEPIHTTIDNNDDQQIPDETQEIRHDEKLEKDINEMSKIKDSSSMAHALLEDLRIQEKIISRQLPLDPWKASRSPSAAIEPPRRCRFESPKFASPSRRVYTHSSSTANQDDSLAVLSTSMSSTPAGGKRIPLSRYQHDRSLTPSNRIDLQRSCDMESTVNSCYSTDRNPKKAIDVNEQSQSTHSAPALMSHPKIYPYEELKVMSKKRFPSDVDRDHLERHLSDQEFQTLFQLTRPEFYRLSEWRRIDLKKRLKLF